jgi:hypothetical protein
MLETIEEAIKNEQSRETGRIGVYKNKMIVNVNVS